MRPGSIARIAASLLTAAPATDPHPSPSFTSQSKISPTRAARIGQRECLAAYGHCMSGSLSRQQVHYWCHPPEFGQHDPVSIPVRSPSSAPAIRFGGFGLKLRSQLANAGRWTGGTGLWVALVMKLFVRSPRTGFPWSRNEFRATPPKLAEDSQTDSSAHRRFRWRYLNSEPVQFRRATTGHTVSCTSP